jgi:hypothetical protein
MEVMVPASQLATGLTASLILLRRGDGQYDVYELSGGSLIQPQPMTRGWASLTEAEAPRPRLASFTGWRQ